MVLKYAKLVEHCLTSTFFNFQGEFYEKTCDVAMGSPLSPIVANLFMEYFETMSLVIAKFHLKKCKRFIDATCVIWPHGHKKLNLFLNHLNSQSDSIKFTVMVEENGWLPFLDIVLFKMDDGSMSHQVFQINSHETISPCQLSSLSGSEIRGAQHSFYPCSKNLWW